MANGEAEDAVESCIFCAIARNQDEDTEILSQNQDLVCFRDIFPAAPHHYLVIPRQHIHSCFSLQSRHLNLVKRMAEMGRAVLREQGVIDMTDTSLGFHKPPYISVDHLHLHVLAPASQISPLMDYKFTPGTSSFVTEECFQKHLQRNASFLERLIIKTNK